ncbi:MAG: cation-transporting P-type ATPase [Syntrophotaleaceae bacterium]
METLLSRHWHHLPPEEIVTLLDSDVEKGLDHFAVTHRQEHFGPNRITRQKRKSPLVLFLQQFHQPLVYILLGATIITLLLREWVDGAVIFGVVLVNAVIGYIQEAKALRAIEALALSMEGQATAVRAGQKQRVSFSELVPGDLVLLQSGDKVPADLRLISARELQIDESALTGESVPVQKQYESLPAEVALADRANMAYSSTLVTYGTGTGIAVATGDGTEIGRINELITSAEVLQTPLTKKIGHFSSLLLWVILVMAGMTFLVGLLHGGTILETFMAAVALAVAAIPEGLPAAMTVMLAIGVGKMARRNAIIRKMPAVETLGSTTVICSDKTGTLTQNQMTVQQIYAGGRHFEVTGGGYSPAGEIVRTGTAVKAQSLPALLECLEAGLFCNDSRLVEKEGRWTYEGDPTEAALLTVAVKAGLDRDQLEKQCPRLDTLPFESEHQYMATLHSIGANGEKVVFLKGSVERVLQRCEDACGEGGSLEKLDWAIIHREAEGLAGEGLRVLALAKKILNNSNRSVSHADVSEGLTFLGLQAMMDPPRKEAIDAVRACGRAGIQVKMITGDHVVTAAAIARQIGIADPSRAIGDFAFKGQDLSQLSDQELIETAERASVFARVAPEQKLRLVEALQTSGHVVAMTGDGVNDAPALKRADIGVAMGAGGTEVAKEAADMVLLDDNFATIEAAVEEGRAVFDTLIKFITWTLPTNGGQALVIFVAKLFGIALPVKPVQILWINMTTAVLLGLMLAFEGKEPGIMERPPRRPETPVLTRELILRIGLVSLMLLIGAFGLFEWSLLKGENLEKARTMAVNMFIFGQLFYLFNCRSLRYSMFKLGVFSNRPLLLGVASMALLQLLFTYAPAMNVMFGSAPLAIEDWIWILSGGLIIYAVIGFEKWLRRRAETRTKALPAGA